METPEEIEKQARSRTKRGFLGLFGRSTEDAQELFTQAANKYKQVHKWKDAARCFSEAAKLGDKNKDYIFVASNQVELSNCLKKLNPTSDEFVEPLMKATQVYNSLGRFAQTGRILKSVAETFEERLDYSNAMKFYKKSAESYELDEFGKISSSQCLLKYADMAASNAELYEEPIQIYEEEGRKNLKNDLLKYGAKDLLFKAGLLRVLNSDATDARIAYAKYCRWDEKFNDSREGRFLSAVIDAVDATDMGEFQEQMKEHDSFTRLDNWKIKILYKLKEKLEGALVGGSATGDSEHVDLT